jgi:hypothetical protein
VWAPEGRGARAARGLLPADARGLGVPVLPVPGDPLFPLRQGVTADDAPLLIQIGRYVRFGQRHVAPGLPRADCRAVFTQPRLPAAIADPGLGPEEGFPGGAGVPQSLARGGLAGLVLGVDLGRQRGEVFVALSGAVRGSRRGGRFEGAAHVRRL